MLTVTLDACTLVPITLCDAILRIAGAGAFGVRWSASILEETERTMVLRRAVPPASAAHRIQQMRRASSLEPWGIEVVHPDAFLLNQLDLAPGHVTTAVQCMLASYKNPPRSLEELLSSLARAGVPDFADELRRHLPDS